MLGSARRAQRLVTWGWLLLGAPAIVLVILEGWLVLHYAPEAAAAAGVVSAAWLVALLGAWLVARREQDLAPGLEDEAGVPVTAEDQPDLWGLVREAADLAGHRAPEELRLTLFGTVRAWPRGRLRLDIAVPVLFVLDPPALGALIARALAEAESGWGDAADPVDRFGRVLDVAARRHLAGPLGRWMRGRIVALRTEGLLAADDVAAQVAGPQTAGRALAWAHVVQAGTQWWLAEFVDPELRRGFAPQPLFPGLESLLGDPARLEAMDRTVRTALPTGDGTGIPGLAERVRSLQLGPEDSPDAVGAPASELLRAPSATLEQVGIVALGPVERDRAWSDVLEDWALRTCHDNAVLLATRTSPTPETLGVVLDGVAGGQLSGWVHDIAREQRSDPHGLAAFVLNGLLVSALVAAGVGRPSALWSGETDVVTAGGERLDVPRAAALLVEDHTLVDELRTLLVELGASMDFVPTHPAGAVGPVGGFLRGHGRRHWPGTGFPVLPAPS